jgi:mannitol/fructose-specific phosphotransferase system IIA component (Ntr-type)
VAIDLARLFRPETVTPSLKSPDKEAAIADLLDLLLAAGEISDRQAALEAVLEREGKMSTGMQNGIAIPHGKSGSVSGIVAALGVHRRGVEFQSLDGKSTHIIVVTVSPPDLPGPHVQFLAEIGRLLADHKTRESILKARTSEELAALLAGTP